MLVFLGSLALASCFFGWLQSGPLLGCMTVMECILGVSWVLHEACLGVSWRFYGTNTEVIYGLRYSGPVLMRRSTDFCGNHSHDTHITPLRGFHYTHQTLSTMAQYGGPWWLHEDPETVIRAFRGDLSGALV